MKGLIVGLGSIARKHIAAIWSIDPSISLFALRSQQGNKGIDGVTDICEPFDDWDNFDFIIVSNPTSCHADTLKRLAGSHNPVFIEKPVVDSLSRHEAVDELVESGRLTYVACNLRFLECLCYVKDYLKNHPERKINEVNVYCGSYLPDWRPGTDFRSTYSARPELGGGVNIDLIHEIDYIYWLFGCPEKSRGLCASRSSLEIDAIDYANYILVYQGFIANVILNYYRRDYRRTLEIVFDDDTWSVNLASNTVSDSKGNHIFESTKTIADTYRSQMKYFLESVRNGCHPENDARTAFDVLKICLDYERLS